MERYTNLGGCKGGFNGGKTCDRCNGCVYVDGVVHMIEKIVGMVISTSFSRPQRACACGLCMVLARLALPPASVVVVVEVGAFLGRLVVHMCMFSLVSC